MNPLEGDANPHLWLAITIALLITIPIGLLALLKPTMGDDAYRRIEKSFSRLAGHKKLVVGGTFLAVVAVRLAVLPLLPVPVPGVSSCS